MAEAVASAVMLVLILLFFNIAVAVAIGSIFRARSVAMGTLTAIGVISVATAISAIDLAVSVTSVTTFSYVYLHFCHLLTFLDMPALLLSDGV